MPDIRPFRGVRYDVARVGDLADVVAPPYDVVDPALQRRLYDASPHNVIRLELTRDEPGDAEGRGKYRRAADLLKEWKREGVLREDNHPALYLYEQIFDVEGVSHTRRGFFARVRLERFGEGKIFPHEQTLAGPKADRLALYHATGHNLSPIFGLYPDEGGKALDAVAAGVKDRTPLEATDHLGVVNRLWPVLDQEAHTAAAGLMAGLPVYIADGHHRYETGVRYRDELAAAGSLAGPDDPANFAMMMLVGMSDPGLLILPTHRLVGGLPGLTTEELTRRLAPEFDVRPAFSAREAWEEIATDGSQEILGFGTTADGAWITAKLRSDAAMDRLAPEHSAEWRSLGVSILHVLVLKSLLADLGDATCRYAHRVDEVEADVADRGCDLACLVPPAEMGHVEAIAAGGETMPPKSTYFYPKLLTGLVLNPLR